MNFTKYFVEIAKGLRVNFTFNGKDLTHEQVFHSQGLLPGLFKRADQLSNFCLGKGLGVTFEDNKAATLGITFKIDDTVSNAYRVLCVTEIICEMIEASPDPKRVPLDSLQYD